MLRAAPDLREIERRDGHLTFLAFEATGMPIGVAMAPVSPLGLGWRRAPRFPTTADAAGTELWYTHDGSMQSVRRGTPALAVQDGANSRPIFERLGFQTVCTLHAVTDRATL